MRIHLLWNSSEACKMRNSLSAEDLNPPQNETNMGCYP